MDEERAKKLRDGVQDAYSAAATDPDGFHPFPVGRNFALNVGYPDHLIEAMPSCAIDSFAGVTNLSVIADIPQGSTVLDFGCGAGLDSLIAAKKVGVDGKVIGVDFSQEMISLAREAAEVAEIGNVEFIECDAENIPVNDAHTDVILVNGIFNLNPYRDPLFREMARVIRPGGTAHIAEIIMKDVLPEEDRKSEVSWFA